MPDFLTYNLTSKYVGVGINLALLKENYTVDPQFLFFFSNRLYKLL